MDFNDYPFQSLMYIIDRPDFVATHGKGSWLYDHTGKRYLDFVQGWAVNCLGHCNDRMIEALNQQACKLIQSSAAFYNEPMLWLAKLLTEHSCFQKVFFTNNGAEANEGAIKLARKWGSKFKKGAYEIITFHHSFHGRTLATMSASGKPGWETLYVPKVPGFFKADLNDLSSVEQYLNDNTVAVIIEPVQGEAGVIPTTNEFMQQLRELTKAHQVLLIVDEVQSGCGRTGTLFAYEQSGIEPDMMTLGKGIGGGVPLAALLCREEISCFEAGEQGGTYNGNPLMTAVGLAVFEQLLAPGFLPRVRELSEILRNGLLKLSDEYGLMGERGSGLMRTLLLGKDISGQIVEKARLHAPDGLLVNAAQPDLLRFMPALNVTEEEIEQMFSILRATFDAIIS